MSANVSRETAERIAAYRELVLKWNGAINLVGRADVEDLIHRHIEDSLQLVELSDVPKIHADFGSGAGFPAIPMAILWEGLGVGFHLVESDKRKAVFLRRAASELALSNITVHDARIEMLPPIDADLVTARALAPLDRLLAYVERHMARDGTAILPKGRTWQTELQLARQNWAFDMETSASQTDPQSSILIIRNLVRHAA